ncbi:hypothetical protein QTO34_015072 [Cnephaeus nilssonii]|uniref:Uncharacterized protein n=1 Tax=Cnephaeus nilssonii TaxID=3371016 RepID=A0AA40I3H6_CNENI|nr:hypothetical protein QTO34_015072 [Eptesicus nilssonii]
MDILKSEILQKRQLVEDRNLLKAYTFTFLLSSRLFIEPRELLARVCQLCIEQQQLDEPGLDKGVGALRLASQARVQKFGPKRLQLLAERTETFPRAFQAEWTIGLVKDVVGRLARCDEVGAPGALPLPAPHCPEPSCPEPAPPPLLAQSRASTLLRPAGPAELAENPGSILPLSCLALIIVTHAGEGNPQLCGCWSGRWSASVECSTATEKFPKDKPCFDEKTKNLEAYVRWFNRLCFLVATEVCMVRRTRDMSRRGRGPGREELPGRSQKGFLSHLSPSPARPGTLRDTSCHLACLP